MTSPKLIPFLSVLCLAFELTCMKAFATDGNSSVVNEVEGFFSVSTAGGSFILFGLHRQQRLGQSLIIIIRLCDISPI